MKVYKRSGQRVGMVYKFEKGDCAWAEKWGCLTICIILFILVVVAFSAG